MKSTSIRSNEVNVLKFFKKFIKTSITALLKPHRQHATVPVEEKEQRRDISYTRSLFLPPGNHTFVKQFWMANEGALQIKQKLNEYVPIRSY